MEHTSTLFIVDDDALLGELLTRHYRRRGYDVRTFTSPAGALEALESGNPDLLLADVQMPGMTGVELVATLRHRGLSLPVILMTGSPNASVRSRAKELGVWRVFEKPVRDISNLDSAIEEALRVSARPEPADASDKDIVTGLSHELRTPLAAIKVALEGLAATDSEGLGPKQRQLIRISQRNIDRLIEIVERQLADLQTRSGAVASRQS